MLSGKWQPFCRSLDVLTNCHQGFCMVYYFNGLVQERRNSSANALELRFSCLTYRLDKYFSNHNFLFSSQAHKPLLRQSAGLQSTAEAVPKVSFGQYL